MLTRGGRNKKADEPERRCIATGQSGETDLLIRFVIGPDGSVVPDLAEKLPGRGIWVSADRAALTRAATKGLFSRAAKAAVTVPPDLADLLDRLLLERSQQLLALARKAGLALCGFEKVRDLLVSGKAVLLLQAADGSERGKDKLRPPEGGSYCNAMSGAELGSAFGRDTVIHAGLMAGGITERILRDTARLSALRDGK